jgi:hypothetical protein
MIIVLIIIAIIFIIALFYRPLGTGYYSYSPAGLLLLILVVLLILYLLGII